MGGSAGHGIGVHLIYYPGESLNLFQTLSIPSVKTVTKFDCLFSTRKDTNSNKMKNS